MCCCFAAHQMWRFALLQHNICRAGCLQFKNRRILLMLLKLLMVLMLLVLLSSLVRAHGLWTSAYCYLNDAFSAACSYSSMHLLYNSTGFNESTLSCNCSSQVHFTYSAVKGCYFAAFDACSSFSMQAARLIKFFERIPVANIAMRTAKIFVRSCSLFYRCAPQGSQASLSQSCRNESHDR